MRLSKAGSQLNRYPTENKVPICFINIAKNPRLLAEKRLCKKTEFGKKEQGTGYALKNGVLKLQTHNINQLPT